MFTLLAARVTNPALTGPLNSVADPGAAGTLTGKLVGALISLAFAVGGLTFFMMLLRGGYEYLTAGGDKDAVQRSTKTLTHALIGIAILLSFYAIVLIVETFFGISLTQPVFPTIQ